MDENANNGNDSGLHAEISSLRAEIASLRAELESMHAEVEAARQMSERAADPRAFDTRKAQNEYESRIQEINGEEKSDADIQQAVLDSMPGYKEIRERFDSNMRKAESDDLQKMTRQRFDAEVRTFVEKHRDEIDAGIAKQKAEQALETQKKIQAAKDDLQRTLSQLDADLSEKIENVEGAMPENPDDTDPKPPEWRDEIEPDSVVMDGETQSGGSAPRREDKSIEWVSGEAGVLRLYDWTETEHQPEWEMFTTNQNPNSSSNDDGIRFLVRVPVNKNDLSKGFVLKYAKILRYRKVVCQDQDSDSDSD